MTTGFLLFLNTKYSWFSEDWNQCYSLFHRNIVPQGVSHLQTLHLSLVLSPLPLHFYNVFFPFVGILRGDNFLLSLLSCLLVQPLWVCVCPFWSDHHWLWVRLQSIRFYWIFHIHCFLVRLLFVRTSTGTTVASVYSPPLSSNVSFTGDEYTLRSLVVLCLTLPWWSLCTVKWVLVPVPYRDPSRLSIQLSDMLTLRHLVFFSLNYVYGLL